MKQLTKDIFMILGLLLFISSQSISQSKWAPIILGDITTFVPYFADDLPIPVDTSILLTSGQAQTNIADRGTYVHYKVYAHAGDVVKIDLYDMDANGNLYVKIGSQASLNSYDCKSENGGETHSTENDSCSITVPSDGYVYMAVYAPNYGCYNNVKHTIKVSINPIVYGQEGIHDVSTRKDADAEYKIYYPSDIANMGKTPLIFFCPGFNSGVDGYDSLLRFIASHGYVVVIAKDNYGNPNSLIPRFEKMLSIQDTIYNHLDKSRIGVIGHSSGGGNTFKILDYYSKKGYGNNGRLLMALDPYFAYGMSEQTMKELPNNTKVVVLQFGKDGGATDPRIVLSEYKLLESIPNSQKDYQVYTQENANHGYASGNKSYANMQGVLKPLDALMAYAFEGKDEAHDTALEVGSDTPLADDMQELRPIDDYQYACSDQYANPEIRYCEVYNEIDPISTAKSTYNTKDTISVNVQGELSGVKDWVAIFAKGSESRLSNIFAWNWVGEGITALTLNKIDMPAGEYEVRLFFNGSYDVEESYGFSVIGGNEDKKYPKTRQLKNTPQPVDPVDYATIKPNKGQTKVDVRLNTKTTQIEKADSRRSPYPKVQAWNADISLLRIGYRIYDAKTYKETAITKGKNGSSAPLCYGNAEYMRWSNKDPQTFYLTQNSNHKLIKGEIIGNEVNCTTLDSFNDGYEHINMTLEEGNIDNNDQYVVMLAKKVGDTTMYIVKYDLKNEKREWVKALDDDEWVLTENEGWRPTYIDWISISPSGKHIVRNNSRAGKHTGVGFIYTYDENLNNKRTLTFMDNQNNKVPLLAEHGDIGTDSKGNDVWVQFTIDQNPRGIYMFDLSKPNEAGKAIISSTNLGGGHISCRNIQRKELGWCYVVPYEEKYGYALALRLKALKDAKNDTEKENVQLFSQLYTKESTLTFGGVSPDGTKVIFNELFNSYYANGNWYYEYNTFIAEVK